MPFEWVLALRFLREGRMQTALIMAGTTVGVAVIIFITTLVNGLQISLASRTLSTQAHITVRAPDDAPTPVLDRTRQAVAAHVEPRVQRLRSIDQWERIYRELPTLAHVVDVSPIATGSGLPNPRKCSWQRSAMVWRASRPVSEFVSTVTANPFEGTSSNEESWPLVAPPCFTSGAPSPAQSSIQEMPIDSHMLPAGRWTCCMAATVARLRTPLSRAWPRCSAA